MRKVILIGLLSVLTLGCATRGRVAVIDLDMRDKDQIEASQNENSVIYQPTEQKQEVVAQPREPSIFYLIDFLKIAKMRIRIVSVEWDEYKKNTDTNSKAIWIKTQN